MTKQIWRTLSLVLMAGVLGAVISLQLGRPDAEAEGKVFEFIKAYEMANARTVVVNDDSTRFAFITNQTGTKANQSMSEDIGEQAEAAFANLDRELKAAGMKPTDVFKLTIYVKNLDLVEGGYVLRAAQIYFDGKITPLITWVGVTTLMLPQALVEIEALAVTRN